EIDEGDYYLFRAALKFSKALCLFVSSYNLDISPQKLAAILSHPDPFVLIKSILDEFPDFLKLINNATVNGPQNLLDAKQAILDAIDDYNKASDAIRNDKSTSPGAEELIEIDECMAIQEKFFRDELNKFKTALSNGTSYTFTDTCEIWKFEDENQKPTFLEIATGWRGEKWHSLQSADSQIWDASGWIECIRDENGHRIFELSGYGYDATGNWQQVEIIYDADQVDETAGTMSGRYTITKGDNINSGNFTANRIESETENFVINPLPLFGNPGPYNLRDFLPQFNSCGTPIPGTVGYGLNNQQPDATLGGILPNMTQDDYEIPFVPEGEVDITTINSGDITVDGNINDWLIAGIPASYTGIQGEDNITWLSGTDIQNVYLAKDDKDLYGAITFYDGKPTDQVYYYLIFTPTLNMDLFEINTPIIIRIGGNGVNLIDTKEDLISQFDSSDGESAYSDSEGVVEWKIELNKLSDFGDISGRLISFAVIPFYSTYWANYKPTCLRLKEGQLPVGTTTISGRVITDAPGYSVGISNAKVEVEGSCGDESCAWETVTDQNGNWQIPGIPKDTYKIIISAPNFQTKVIEGVEATTDTVNIHESTMEVIGTGGCPWDINKNNQLDLYDIIFGLQVISGMRQITPSTTTTTTTTTTSSTTSTITTTTLLY
ncbi:MAG: hypothetical protein DRN95_07705, partial [Candidatus Hydrothermarchaeota archaeon]